MPFTNQELQKIRQELPKGTAQLLADEFGFKAGSVRNILSGISQNDAVVIRAIAIAIEHKEKLQTAKQTAATL